MKFIKRFALFLAIAGATSARAQKVELLQEGKKCSFRGLSVVNDQIAWASGSNGNVAKTTDGGKTWQWQQVKDFERADFRDIEAFSDKEAVIIAAGSPALIMKTSDGGLSWQLVYKKDDEAYFLDAMDFADREHGYILGDPINGKFLLLETKDGGATWNDAADMPKAAADEAAFAASGTCLRVLKKSNQVVVVTGGPVSNKLTYTPGKGWLSEPLPLAQGVSSKGAFSIAFSPKYTIAVGGDYQKDKKADSVAVYQAKDKTGYRAAKQSPSGFQSSVEALSPTTFLATGTAGTNITTDGGNTWTKINDLSFNVCIKAKKGKLVLLAGDKGKIGVLKY